MGNIGKLAFVLLILSCEGKLLAENRINAFDEILKNFKATTNDFNARFLLKLN